MFVAEVVAAATSPAALLNLRVNGNSLRRHVARLFQLLNWPCLASYVSRHATPPTVYISVPFRLNWGAAGGVGSRDRRYEPLWI